MESPFASFDPFHVLFDIAKKRTLHLSADAYADKIPTPSITPKSAKIV